MTDVLLLTHEFPPFAGGIANMAHGLAIAASELGISVRVVAPDFGHDLKNRDRSQPYEIRRFRGGQFRMRAPHRFPAFLLKCSSELRATSPSVVHAVDPAAQLAVQVLKRSRTIPRVMLTICGSELLLYKRRMLFRLFMRDVFAKGVDIVAISENVRQRLTQSYKVDQDQVRVSYPGIAPLWSSPEKALRLTVRRNLGVQDSDFLLVTVARRVREKGHDRIIAALAVSPPSARARVTYVIVGDGPPEYRKELEHQAATAGVRLILPGYMPDAAVRDLYDSADLFTMLSRETPERVEGFGLTYLEAGARGVPSLASATGGVPEVVRHEESGQLVAADASPTEIMLSLTQLIENPQLRAEMGAKAKGIASAFTWVRNARETYRELLRNG